MNSVALLTPTYGRDLKLCTLLCESVDRHVGSFSKPYLLVPDCDASLFLPNGYFVGSDAGFSPRHIRTPGTPFVSYWDQPKLGRNELNQLLCGANKDDAYSAASFSGTPVETIRAAITESTAIRAPVALSKEAGGLAALC